MKLILIDCNGLNISYNDKFERVIQELSFIDSDADIWYLQDADGMILCTLLGNRTEYERNVNYDRRLQNSRNGFIVEFDTDDTCSWCCVRKNRVLKRGERLRRLFPTIVVTLLSLIVGVIIGTITNSCNEDKGSNVITELDTIPLTVRDAKLVDSTPIASNQSGERDSYTTIDPAQENHVVEYSKENKVREDARMYKKKLQSMECSYKTVKEVDNWWGSLCSEDKQFAKEVYNFDTAIRTYRRLFTTDDLFELERIIMKERGFFSKEQYKTLRMVSRSKEASVAMRKNLRFWSFRDIERHISMMGLMK